MAKVIIENVYKIFPGDKGNAEKIAVRDANFEIHDQEFMILVGPSGCGKTTTLRMIAGLEEISKGTIRIGDRVINDVPPKDRDIAMVFQNYALYPHMTVYKNMAFGLQLRGYDRVEIDRRVQSAADILGLRHPDNLLERKPKALSGGQRQRVALGRAIVRQPQAFLFDEPLSNLDAKMRVEMRSEISKLHQRLKSTMIYVTHDQIEAMTMADRIVVMKDGVIQQIDEPINLYNTPSNLFVAGFIGSPAMNFLHGTVQASSGSFEFVEHHADAQPTGLRIRLTADQSRKLAGHENKKVVCGIRPEDIEEASHASDHDPAHQFEATLEVIEPMGAESYLYVRTDAHSLIIRSREFASKKEVGKRLRFGIKIEKVRLFDSTTELLIT